MYELKAPLLRTNLTVLTKFRRASGRSLMGISASLLYAHHTARRLESGDVRSLHRRKLEKVSDVALILGVLLVILQVNHVLMACCIILLTCIFLVNFISSRK